MCIADPRRERGVTLLELLVVVSTIALLTGLLVPGLSRARAQARGAVCGSNVRQIALANSMYAQESAGMFTPGAVNMATKNLHRWHGVRDKVAESFEPARGPLAPYMGSDKGIRACPAFEPARSGFEKGNGGYGYNNAYVGVQTVCTAKGQTIVVSDGGGVRLQHVLRPAQTLMFADAAFVDGDLIEYSFAEPRFHPQFQSRADPSIHFRHNGHANIAWCDGHVSPERMTFTQGSGFFEGDPGRYGIGWFGKPDDNTFFDLN